MMGNAGRIQPIGTPKVIDEPPANQFVADFIGASMGRRFSLDTHSPRGI